MKKATSNRMHIIVLATLILCFGCGEKIEPGTVEKKPSVTVKARVETARMISRPVFEDFVGTVQAGVASTLSAKTMGSVREVRVREGDLVKSGQVLVVIDDTQAAARLEQAEAALAEARKGEAAAVSALDATRAGADLARATFQRYLQLMEDQSASRQEFDEVQARHRQAQATLSQTGTMVDAARHRIRQAEAVVDGARSVRKDAIVTAPYDGLVTARQVEAGDLASPGKPLISLEEAGGFRVDMVLPESRIHSVRPGQTIRVRIPAIREEPLPGEVKAIVPTADQRTRSFLVKVAVSGIPGMRSGMFARVGFPVRDDTMLLIPASAVRREGQLTGIFLVDGENIASFRLIRTGRELDDGVEVISGLSDGNRYVAEPAPRLVDGARVEVSP